jgi:hypothetical protein
MYWPTALLLVAMATIALLTVLPVTSLWTPGSEAATRLALPAGPAPDPSVHWRTLVHTPATTRQEAITAIFTLLLGSALATLALAALTILGLSAARASARAGEISVRRAVGASRRGLLGASLLEGVTIGGAALAFGVVAGIAGARIAAAGWPGILAPGALAPSAAAACTTVVGVIVGALFPLLFARRRRVTEVPAKPLELYIPALQLGVSLVVLTAGALLAQHGRTLLESQSARPAGGQVIPITMAGLSPAERSLRYANLLDSLGGRPGTVSLVSPGALVGLGTGNAVTTDCGHCSESLLPLRWHVVGVSHLFVSADSFRALGVHLVAGRTITSADRWDAAPVAVVNRQLAARHFQNGEAIGREMQVGDDPRQWYTVVGIVDDPSPVGLGAALQPPFTVYLSVLQHPAASVELLMRPPPGGGVEPLPPSALRQILGTAGIVKAPVSEAALIADEAAPLAWFGRWFGVEGWAMLVVAAAGTFVLMRLWVLSLLPELGLRRAVGARRRHLLGFVLSRAAFTAIGGIGLGLWFGPSLWDTLTDVVTGLPSWDARVVTRFALLLIATTLAGALLPALRAALAAPSRLIGSAGE